MTNNKKEKKEELFKSGTPHFFKVILKDDILNGTLRIPKKFAQKHGSALSDVVHLELPSGRVWEVELRRDDGELFLQNGWADFAQGCCISFRYFVVFRYEGDSRFHVVIFDVTACEIEYPEKPGTTATTPGPGNTRPCTPLEVGRTGKGEVGIIELSDDEDLDPCLGSDRKKPPLYCPQSTKRSSRTRSPGADCSASEMWFRNSMDERPRGSERVFSAAKSGAFLRASSYKCNMPSTIVVVRSRRGLYLPLKFWTTCFPGGIGDIKVFVSRRKTWTIRANNSKYPKFRVGWKNFLKDNSLTEGDVCLFEVVESSEPEFRVFIFRQGDDVTRMPTDTADLECNYEAGRRNTNFSRAVIGETSAIDSLGNVRSSDLLSRRKLQCECHLVSSNEVGKTGEEKVLVEEVNEDGGSDVCTDSNGKNSHMCCRFSTSEMGRTGKTEVQIEESSNNENLDAHVSGDRKRPPSHCPQPSKRWRTNSQGIDARMVTSISSSPRMQLQELMERHHPGRPAEFGIRVAGYENSGALQGASSFLIENPSCIVVIRSIKHLYFPINFLMTCFPGGRETFGDIKVCVSGKGTWTLRVNKERYPRFFQGWKEFVADNELRIGDVCLFKLMRSVDVEFRVVIFREEEEITAHIRALLRHLQKRPRKSADGSMASWRHNDSSWLDFKNWGCGNNLFF